MELCLKRGLVWEYLGWKLITLTTFFVKLHFTDYCYNMSSNKGTVEQAGFKNGKIDES